MQYVSMIATLILPTLILPVRVVPPASVWTKFLHGSLRNTPEYWTVQGIVRDTPEYCEVHDMDIACKHFKIEPHVSSCARVDTSEQIYQFKVRIMLYFLIRHS